jgi:hypothetical protein
MPLWVFPYFENGSVKSNPRIYSPAAGVEKGLKGAVDNVLGCGPVCF